MGLPVCIEARVGEWVISPRKKAFNVKAQRYLIVGMDDEAQAVDCRFESGTPIRLHYWRFNHVIGMLREAKGEYVMIGSSLNPDRIDTIEGSLMKEARDKGYLYAGLRTAPFVCDLVVLCGYAEYGYTRNRDTGKKVQGIHYLSGTPKPIPPKIQKKKRSKQRQKTRKTEQPVSDQETYLEPRREAILSWAEKNKETIIENRLNYHWKSHTRLECEGLRNDVSRKIIESRINNRGALDIETLNAVIQWGFGRDYPNQDRENALSITSNAFNYLDKGDLVNATITLCEANGVGISRASKIIGLFDQENLCIYDSRVGVALKTLTYQDKRMIKIPPGYNRKSDTCSYEEFAQNYQRLIWILEEIRDYMNRQGCTYRIADIEMALFMMGQ